MGLGVVRELLTSPLGLNRRSAILKEAWGGGGMYHSWEQRLQSSDSQPRVLLSPLGALGNGWRHSAYQSQLQGPLAFSGQGDAANVLMHKTKSSPSPNFECQLRLTPCSRAIVPSFGSWLSHCFAV